MSGRYTVLDEDFSFMSTWFGVDVPEFPYGPRYNIAPTQSVPIIVSDEGRKSIRLARWGLVPNWWHQVKLPSLTFNARSETLLDKPSFRNLLQKNRCLVPADGFYEWQQDGKKKRPLRICITDRPMFAFAGLYDEWTGPDGTAVVSCTIITCEPNEFMIDIHDRMPVILPRDAETTWLDTSQVALHVAQSLLQPYPAEQMTAYPVPDIVGNVAYDMPECVRDVRLGD